METRKSKATIVGIGLALTLAAATLGTGIAMASEDPWLDEEMDISGQLDVAYTADDFMFMGEILYGDFRYTWYSQNVLPGDGLDIPGRHVEDGYVVDEYGYTVLATCEAEYGATMDIPVGTGIGKVYDYCDEPGTVDVYTDF